MARSRFTTKLILHKISLDSSALHYAEGEVSSFKSDKLVPVVLQFTEQVLPLNSDSNDIEVGYSVLYRLLYSPRGTFNSLYATRLRSHKWRKSNPLTEGIVFRLSTLSKSLEVL